MIRTQEQVIADAIPILRQLQKKYDSEKYYFDYDLALKYIKFVSFLKHTAGELGGVNWQLLPFQVEFIASSLAVLHRDTQKRRFKTAILHIPRKNGKSELLGAIIVLMYFMDKEKAKELYTIASETEQAKIVFKVAQSMIKQTGYLENLVNIYKSTRTIESKGEFSDVVKVLTSNADTKDGLRCSTLIADECHSYKDDSLFKVVEESMISRSEPITFMISTAGYNLEGFYYQRLDYARKVEQGIIKDDTLFSMLFEANPENWQDEQEWIKCNPALGYGVKLENLRDMFVKAQHSGTEEVSFKTKHLNIWTNSADTFIQDYIWQQNMGELPDDEYLKKLPCYGGLDLSSVSDLTAFVLIFIDAEKIYIKSKSYLPKENLRQKARNDEVPYETWVKQGHLSLTEGNVVDYKNIEREIIDACSKYKVKSIGFDRWSSHDIVTRLLEQRVNMIAFGQGWASMNAPVKLIEKTALEKNFISNDPMLRWCISNVVVVRDASDNYKFDKSKVKQKIDLAVALAIALGMYIPDIAKKYAYMERGLREL